MTSSVHAAAPQIVGSVRSNAAIQVYTPSWESCSRLNVRVRVVTLPDVSAVPSVMSVFPSSPVHTTVGVPDSPLDSGTVTVQVRVYCSPAIVSPLLVVISTWSGAGAREEIDVEEILCL